MSSWRKAAPESTQTGLGDEPKDIMTDADRIKANSSQEVRAILNHFERAEMAAAKLIGEIRQLRTRGQEEVMRAEARVNQKYQALSLARDKATNDPKNTGALVEAHRISIEIEQANEELAIAHREVPMREGLLELAVEALDAWKVGKSHAVMEIIRREPSA